MNLDALKKEFVEDIGRDRTTWFWLMIPQIVLVGLAATCMAGIATFGLYISVTTIREKADAELLTKATTAFVGGSSTLLGIFVIRMLGKAAEYTQEYMAGRRRFTGFIARVKSTETADDYDKVAKEYQK
jgi:hypothetical protein